MKTIVKIFSFILLASIVLSCGEDSNMDSVGNWELSTPAPTTPVINANIVLQDNLPASAVRFEWQPAATSNRFIIQYKVHVVTAGSTDFENALMTLTPGNAGKNAFVETTAQQIDYILWTRCYPAGAEVDLEWVVVAKSIDKTTTVKQAFSITRFQNEYVPETMFITGGATEAGEEVAAATKMRAHKNANGINTNIFDVYTTLTAGKSYFFRNENNTLSKMYGGNEGTLQGCGAAITAPETGQYRVTVNLNNNTYSLLKIDRWSLVGDAVEGGWGGDVPLTYQGKGVWAATIELYKPGANAGFLFRANGDWAYLLKRIVSTGNADNTRGNLIMESEAAGMGKTFEDVAGPKEGMYKVTLNLASDVYTYLLEKQGNPAPTPTIIGQTASPNGDQVSGNFTFGDYNTPSELYLLADGVLVGTFEKDGDEFSSVKFWALQQNKTYTINSADDGSGTTYGEVNDGEMGVARDQAYKLIVNFDTGKLSWKYNNMKLFHWSDAPGGWDARQELLMTYEHPYTFKVSGTLSAGFLSKFNSPWDVQFGTAGTALSGTMTNGGENFTGIVANGTYNATIVVTNDFASCEYIFQKQ